MKKRIIPMILCLCFIFSNITDVNANTEMDKFENNNSDNSNVVKFYENILEKGIISTDGEFIFYNDSVYIYDDVLKYASGNLSDVSDEYLLSSTYTISNDFTYEYIDKRNPIGYLNAHPGDTISFYAGVEVSSYVQSSIGITAAESFDLGVEFGLSASYTVEKSLTCTNNTSNEIQYGLCIIYTVHTFDIYKNNTYIGTTVFYEAHSMSIEVIKVYGVR